jgi:putative effector of murein hydrolase LrgA (UPF0299 family)
VRFKLPTGWYFAILALSIVQNISDTQESIESVIGGILGTTILLYIPALIGFNAFYWCKHENSRVPFQVRWILGILTALLCLEMVVQIMKSSP